MNYPKLKPGKTNREARLNFVEYWADFVRNNPDEVWSEQQNKLIDMQLDNSKNFKMSRKDYLEIKGEKFKL